jgi:hypothetical protein
MDHTPGYYALIDAAVEQQASANAETRAYYNKLALEQEWADEEEWTADEKEWMEI